MLNWLTVDLIRMMALGLIAGATIKLGYFLARDWQYQIHRWRYRNRIVRGEDANFEELRELEGYRPNAVTDEERAALPSEVIFYAFAGAFAGAAMHAPLGAPHHVFWLLAAITLARIVIIVLLTPTPVVASGDEEAFTRWQQASPLLFELGMFAFMAFAFADLSDAIDRSELLTGTVFNGLGLLFCLALTGCGLWRLREGPPDDLDWSEEARWRGATYMLIGSIPIAALLFGAVGLLG